MKSIMGLEDEEEENGEDATKILNEERVARMKEIGELLTEAEKEKMAKESVIK